MSVPAMDRPSIAFARFLDSIKFETSDDMPPEVTMLMTCTLCGLVICFVEDNDTMRVLLNTALAHDCTG